MMPRETTFLDPMWCPKKDRTQSRSAGSISRTAVSVLCICIGGWAGLVIAASAPQGFVRHLKVQAFHLDLDLPWRNGTPYRSVAYPFLPAKQERMLARAPTK